MLNIISRANRSQKSTHTFLYWFVRTKKTKFPLHAALDQPIKNSQDSDNIVRSWSKKEQILIINSLKEFRKRTDIPSETGDEANNPPTTSQLRKAALQAALPFIVF